MDAGRPTDALTMLVFALDEMRETTSLLPVAEVSRSFLRPWWRNVFFGFARSKAEVSAGQAVQYLGENVDRARVHWREALSTLDELQRTHADNAIVVHLGDQLRSAGLYGILAKLQHDAIPHPLKSTAVHLQAVVATIRDCDHIALDARNKLLLQRIRNE